MHSPFFEGIQAFTLLGTFYILFLDPNELLRRSDNCALWKQVLDVVKKMSSLRKISFLAHSLGGLFARYAIALLYSLEAKNEGQSSAQIVPAARGSAKSRCTSGLGAVAGLEPINFITLATPHLGVRGRNQVGHQNVLYFFLQNILFIFQ